MYKHWACYDRNEVATEDQQTDDVDSCRWGDVTAGVGRFDAIHARMFVLVESANLERARLSTVVALRYDVLRILVDTDAVLEPGHRRVRDSCKVAFEQQRRAFRSVGRLQRLGQLRNDYLLLSFWTRMQKQTRKNDGRIRIRFGARLGGWSWYYGTISTGRIPCACWKITVSLQGCYAYSWNMELCRVFVLQCSASCLLLETAVISL